MKKKTALTLGAIALLSAGVTFGVKFKQKKDFEKTLKTILIPEAEKELETLLSENSALNDSILKYQQELNILNNKIDSINNLRKSDAYQRRGVNGTLGEVYDVISGLYAEWDDKLYNIFYRDLGNDEHENHGNWEVMDYTKGDVPKDKRAIESYKRAYQLTGNKSHNFPNTPAHGAKFVLKSKVLVPDIYLNMADYKYDYSYVESKYVNHDVSLTEVEDIEDFFTTILDAISSTAETTFDNSSAYSTLFAFHNTHPGLKLAILKSLQSFVNAVDNSDKVLNERALKELKLQIKEMIPIVQQEYKLALGLDAKEFGLKQKKEQASKKLGEFKSGKTAVENRVKQQKEKIKVLKTSEIAKLMKEHRKR